MEQVRRCSDGMLKPEMEKDTIILRPVIHIFDEKYPTRQQYFLDAILLLNFHPQDTALTALDGVD